MATRVSNQFRVTATRITSSGGKKVTFTPVYTGDPDFSTNTAAYDNPERSIEIYVPKNSSAFDTFDIDEYFYMDFTAA